MPATSSPTQPCVKRLPLFVQRRRQNETRCRETLNKTRGRLKRTDTPPGWAKRLSGPRATYRQASGHRPRTTRYRRPIPLFRRPQQPDHCRLRGSEPSFLFSSSSKLYFFQGDVSSIIGSAASSRPQADRARAFYLFFFSLLFVPRTSQTSACRKGNKTVARKVVRRTSLLLRCTRIYGQTHADICARCL